MQRTVKKILKYTVTVILTAAAYAAAILTFTVDSGNGGESPDIIRSGNPAGFEDLRDFSGFFAYNAIDGTAAELKTAEKKVLVCRNTFPDSGYSPAGTRRPGASWAKCAAGGISNPCLSTKYFFLLHNDEILGDSLPTGSERIHLLRILII